MKLAVVPWSDEFLENRMFDIDDPYINRDNRLNSFWEMRNEFLKNGDEFETVDRYEHLEEVDYFLFFELDLRWIEILLDRRLEARMVYCNAEPAVVNPLNSKEGFEKLKKLFPYIMTWDDSLVDRITVFKRNIPHFFQNDLGDIPFEERKLLVNISGNKKSKHPQELYSQREKAISFFETNYKEDFDLFGTGWDVKVHPSYRGRAGEKTELYHHYRFALALENMGHTQGYITEKIFDCLSAGVIPIYEGADNIEDYVPAECFIKYGNFSSLQDLAEFLKGMDRERFYEYQNYIRRFLESDIAGRFTGTEYARDVYEMIRLCPDKSFRIGLVERSLLKMILVKRNCTRNLKKVVGQLIKRDKGK